MFSFFKPRYVKEGETILKNAHKLLHYKRDLLSEAAVDEFKELTDELRKALNQRDEKAAQEATKKLEAKWSRYLPPAEEAGWRENCEVFLVAIIIALAVRTYYVQPFTIPTGSMQPTLYGIIGTETNEPAPSLPVRLLHLALYGRSYIDVVAQSDEAIEQLAEHKRFLLFTVTDIICTHNTYHAWAPQDTLTRYFNLSRSRQYKKGDVIVRGHVNTGDHVFVDKISYNFCPPKRGNVFVFSTLGISQLEAQTQNSPADGSQFYIKRLAGLPGDTLRIEPPKLFVNGSPAQGFGFERVMSQQDGYHGYFNGQREILTRRGYPVYGFLTSPESEVHLPAKSYFALGDNSGNSLDSRYWGSVPQRNIMGQAVFVYWPFASHWGLIK